MIEVVVDVDDTIISTDRSMHAVWCEILRCEVPLEAVQTLGLDDIFIKFASPEQKTRADELQRRFWDISLGLEEPEADLFRLHEPIPFSAEILQEWTSHCNIVYLTGRPEIMRGPTLCELKQFGFPTEGTQLVMFSLEDFARVRGINPRAPPLADARSKLFSAISKEHSIIRVVDDYPGYFPIYRQYGVPDRIGLLRSKYTLQQYIDKGATRAVTSWLQLKNDLPKNT